MVYVERHRMQCMWLCWSDQLLCDSTGWESVLTVIAKFAGVRTTATMGGIACWSCGFRTWSCTMAYTWMSDLPTPNFPSVNPIINCWGMAHQIFGWSSVATAKPRLSGSHWLDYRHWETQLKQRSETSRKENGIPNPPRKQSRSALQTWDDASGSGNNLHVLTLIIGSKSSSELFSKKQKATSKISYLFLPWTEM